MARIFLFGFLCIVCSALSGQEQIRDLVPDQATLLSGDAVGDLAGSAVLADGDFNGDGIEDLAFSAPNADIGNLANAGAVYIVFGGVESRPNVSIAELRSGDGSMGVIIEGEAATGLMGRSLAAADLNNDGIDDIAIGAPQLGNGLVYVLFGQRRWASAVLNVSQIRSVTSAEANTLGIIMSGAQPAGRTGESLRRLNDFNGDGREDLLITGNLPIGTFSNFPTQSFVLFGRDGDGVWPPVFNLVQLRDTVAGDAFGLFILSAIVEDGGGTASAAAEDLNGDGLSDVIYAAPDADGSRGKIHFLLGAAEYQGNVGFNDIFSSQVLGDISGAEDDLRFGTTVSSIGDFNGDGREDFAVGVPDSNDRNGRVYVLHGPAPGEWQGSRSITSLLENNRALRLDGISNERLGASVTAAGDRNGDGLADLLIGAQNFADRSGVYIVSGTTTTGTASISDLGQYIQGNSGDDSTGRAISGTGDFNADGSSDLIVGAPFDDSGAANSGSIFALYGNTEDATPRLEGDLSHAWYDPSGPGQGVLAEFGTLDGEPGVFATWYTFDNGAPLWLTTGIQTYTPSTRTIQAELFQANGGGFGDAFDPDAVAITRWGEVTITLTDCDQLLWNYRRDSDGSSGQLSLVPLLADQTQQDPCTKDDAPSQPTASRLQRGLAGTLWNPERAGEGVMLDFEPRSAVPGVFFSWFTFDPSGAPVWLVAFSGFNFTTGTAGAMVVFQARGAQFGAQFNPQDVELIEWGVVSLELPDCDSGTLTYNGVFPDGQAASGSIDLVRFTDGLNAFTCRN